MHRHTSLGFAGKGLALVFALFLAGTASAQNATENDVARARRLVNAGERGAAQSLAAAMLEKYPEGTSEYADGLYVRALAANSAAEAERDYLRLSIEYPLSSRAEDALMMVGQLRVARGDRAGARRAFERLTRDHPSGEQMAKASYWFGRLALDDGDGALGCPALQRAQSLVTDDDVELKNQVDFHVRRCQTAGGFPVRDTTPIAPAPPPKSVATKPAPRPATPPRRQPQRAVPVDTPMVADTVPTVVAPVDSVVRDSAPPATPRTEPTREPAPPPVPAKPAKEWSVQAAAFPKQRDALALSEVLAQRGYQARVVGTRAPFRVRVGRWATREEAESALGGMRRMLRNGIVVEAEPQ